MIAKLLIANRGEIACRIMRTARAMGIATVAVYSDADAKALHVRQADEAVHIGPSPAAESYLRGDRIIAAAKETGAEAIHPGYGFLSENAEFARAVINAGLIWVGPKPESIKAMGLKDAAKKLMRKAGVPVTPGYEGADQSPRYLAEKAKEIGYPILIKAVAGGGGKGMRKVEAPQDFEAALESCKREARSSFGNDQVLLEKWINAPRHIEVQVFGDSQGNVVHLFERDCSLQRRHQKVIEEAPAPGMDAETREAICAAAARAAKAVDYEGAGTVEFIADASDGLRADRIFFMEMNTRLQVEHPVTEEITGVDLVDWQLRVASGEALPCAQEELSISGHAIEARLYAEDPASGFLPSVGRLERLDLNQDQQSLFPDAKIRIETGVAQGDTISAFYDPMIAKLVVHASDRDKALSDMSSLIHLTEIWPIRSNAPFLSRALDHDEFMEGGVTTAFLECHHDELIPNKKPLERHWALAARLMLDDEGVDEPSYPSPHDFRLNAEPRRSVWLSHGEETREILFEGEAANIGGFGWHTGDSVSVFDRGGYFEFFHASRGDGKTITTNGTILAPMPGKVIACDIAQGDAVTQGQRLLVLEAMKMEHALTAPFDGVVAELLVSAGDQVQVEQMLVRVEALDE